MPADRRRTRGARRPRPPSWPRIGQPIDEHFGVPRTSSGRERRRVLHRPVPADHRAARPEAPIRRPSGCRNDHTIYVRASIVEQLPDPLTPLFADLIDGSVARSLEGLFGELLGKDLVRAGDVGLPTINGYAYYRYTPIRDVARIMLRRARRPSGCSPEQWNGSLADYSHPRYRRVSRLDGATDRANSSTDELLAGVGGAGGRGNRVLHGGADDHPDRCLERGHLTRFYNAVVRRKGDPPAQVFVLGSDSEPIRAEKSLYDLATWTRQHQRLAESLLGIPSHELLEPAAGVGRSRTGLSGRRRFQHHLGAYGHAVYNLDFINPVPADDPAPLLDTLRFFVRGRALIRTSGSGAWRSGARRRRPRFGRGSIPYSPRPSAGWCTGRRTWRRSARTRWPTSGWPGLSCAACSPKSGGASGERCDQQTRRRVLAAPLRDRRRSGQPR